MEDSEEEEDGEEYEDQLEDEIAEDEEQMGRVEDADWELARGDFTKMFNRSRQLAQIAGQSSSNASGSNVPLPAMNRARRTKAKPSRTPAKAQDEEGKQADDINTNTNRTPADKIEEQLSSLRQKFGAQMRIDDTYDPSAITGGALSANVPRKGNTGMGEKRVRDKSDRSTVQQVLDPRTMVILFKMLQRGLLKEINGVISTGKEANVYHASTYKYVTTGEMVANGETHSDEEGLPLALKIYKTTILVFKDRDRYITGEFRFRHGYARHNPRKMVKLWAEKEARNLKRLVGAGIRCPRPIELRDHVLVMEFLEDGTGRNSPRLRDAEKLIDERRQAGEGMIWENLYVEMMVAMRVMYHQCHLVHADLSEYNILYHKEHLYIIDVSQSVEHDHPYAFDFLRADIAHVDEYFAKRGGVQTLGVRKTFEWIVRTPARTEGQEESAGKSNTDDSTAIVSQTGKEAPLNTLATLASGPFSKFEYITRGPGESDEELSEGVRNMMMNAQEEAESGKTTNETFDDAVFRQAYIPQNLNEVFDPERDIEQRNEGHANGLIYANVIGVDGRSKEQNSTENPAGEEDGSDSDDSDEEEDSDSEEGAEDGQTKKTPRGHRHEDRDAKKERKKQVKEAAREKRKTKMPKAEKKRRMRTSKK
ncbi:RIO1-domain-containing protein [Meira miltonrushii]|uniref:Serine/threonine-protein kinase RIO1 n=1 Tax=Meira miltonrushii TaxID=1280837 RepID=A0A316V2S6_9BASI|nr:RIO1-domain-containing protein [Meira miltonrushii]PWN31762.1 RIO1-domain-containing protein [Meira miltonrushii]